MQLHPGKRKRNQITSGERKGECSYIRGYKREIRLHPGREKENAVTSGEIKGKSDYIRGEEMQ